MKKMWRNYSYTIILLVFSLLAILFVKINFFKIFNIKIFEKMFSALNKVKNFTFKIKNLNVFLNILIK